MLWEFVKDQYPVLIVIVVGCTIIYFAVDSSWGRAAETEAQAEECEALCHPWQSRVIETCHCAVEYGWSRAKE